MSLQVDSTLVTLDVSTRGKEVSPELANATAISVTFEKSIAGKEVKLVHPLNVNKSAFDGRVYPASKPVRFVLLA